MQQKESNSILNRIFYSVKPLIPRRVQINLRRQIALQKINRNGYKWPIDEKADNSPAGWTGWPDQKKFALVLMHDVETQIGYEKCYQLMELEEKLGFRSCFNFVAERYQFDTKIIKDLVTRGFNIGVHGLKHDGKLFTSKSRFKKRANSINHYLSEWNAEGFTSPSMHRNLDWMHALNIKYDTSTFDTDPFEPQPEGIATAFPLWIPKDSFGSGYVELPYTIPQDFTLFIIMQQKDNAIWKKKLDWIAQKGGMALMITHPDYMNFNTKQLGAEEYPVKYYSYFLEYIKNSYKNQYWHVLPSEIARFWRKNYAHTERTESAER